MIVCVVVCGGLCNGVLGPGVGEGYSQPAANDGRRPCAGGG